MVVIGRFVAFFGRRWLVADADTGWLSAALTDATGCMLQPQAMPTVCSREAARGVAARARDRALFAAAVDAIHKRQLTYSCALFSLVAAEAGASGQ